MLWDLTQSQWSGADQSAPSTPLTETPSLAPPLRRILSRSALAEFSKTLEANGMSPIPAPIPRSASPTRLRKKLSKFSLAPSPVIKTPTPVPTFRPPQTSPERRSPSPPSPATPVPTPAITATPGPNSNTTTPSPNPVATPSPAPAPTSTSNQIASPTPAPLAASGETKRKIIHRTKSLASLGDLNAPTDQLTRSLRSYRKKISNSTDPHPLRPEVIKDFERELQLTLKVLSSKSRRHQSASEANVGDLLDQYSDKIARLVEGKSVSGRGSLRLKRKERAGVGELAKGGKEREKGRERGKERELEKDKDSGVDSSGTNSDPAGKG